MEGSNGQAWPIDGESGSMSTPEAPVELKRPVKGAWIPPKVSQGDGASSKSFSACSAASRLIGVGLLPPSMNTRPESPRAPGLPPKFQVAYAEVIEPPSECPPTTT